MPTNGDVYSPPELAQLLGVTIHTVERMRERGSGPPYYRVSGGPIRGGVGYRERKVEEWLFTRRVQRVGRFYRFKREDIEALLNRAVQPEEVAA